MKKYLKVFSVILCVLLCTSLLLSACLIVHSAEHNCMGENCPVCQAVAAQKELFHSLGLCCLGGIITAGIAYSALLVGALFRKAKRAYSPVENKVKITA